MNNKIRSYKYRSIGQNMFNVWRIIFGFTLLLLLIFCLIGFGFSTSLKLGIGISMFISLLLVIGSLSEIKREERNMFFMDIEKSLELREIQKIETWWNYEFGMSTNVLTEGTNGKTRAHSNKINIYAEIKTKNKTGIIYEQIYMSSKFPNNHQYRHDKFPNRNIMFKVWDLDTCIEKLQLAKYITKK